MRIFIDLPIGCVFDFFDCNYRAETLIYKFKNDDAQIHLLIDFVLVRHIRGDSPNNRLYRPRLAEPWRMVRVASLLRHAQARDEPRHEKGNGGKVMQRVWREKKMEQDQARDCDSVQARLCGDGRRPFCGDNDAGIRQRA